MKLDTSLFQGRDFCSSITFQSPELGSFLYFVFKDRRGQCCFQDFVLMGEANGKVRYTKSFLICHARLVSREAKMGAVRTLSVLSKRSKSWTPLASCFLLKESSTSKESSIRSSSLPKIYGRSHVDRTRRSLPMPFETSKPYEQPMSETCRFS